MRLLTTLCAAILLSSVALARDEFLPLEQAYRYEVVAEKKRIFVSWTITPGYYLYRKKMGFETSTAAVTLGQAVFPTGIQHHDDLGDSEIYRGTAVFELPYKIVG